MKVNKIAPDDTHFTDTETYSILSSMTKEADRIRSDADKAAKRYEDVNRYLVYNVSNGYIDNIEQLRKAWELLTQTTKSADEIKDYISRIN